MRRVVLLAAVSGLLCAAAPAAALNPDKAVTQYAHDVWLPDNGLPQVTVMDMVQTLDGYLWIATQGGLARFDGVRFTVFDKHNTEAFSGASVEALEEDSYGNLWVATTEGGLIRRSPSGEFTLYTADDGLASNVVLSVLEDSKGTLWVGTNAGLNRFRDGKLERLPESSGLATARVERMLEDRTGQLWLGTQGLGLCRLLDGNATCIDRDDGLGSNAVVSLAESADGSLWIGNESAGLDRYHDGLLYHHGPEQGMPEDTVYDLLEDRDGNLWIATDGHGVLRFADGTFTALTPAEGLSGRRCTSLLEDREGSLWIGTFTGGLNRLRDATFVTIAARDGLSADPIWTVLEDRHGAIWVGAMPGLNRIVDRQIVPFAGQQEVADCQVQSLLEAADGALWVGTARQGLKRLWQGRWTSWTTRNGLASNAVFGIVQGHDGVIWVSTRDGLSRIDDEGIRSYTTADGLPHNSLRPMLVDSQGTLWVGTRGGGVALVKNAEITTFDPGVELGPAHLTILTIHEDREGAIWIGTGGGLLRYRNEVTRLLDHSSGLYDEHIHKILEDDAGNYWMSCNNGIFSISKESMTDFFTGRSDRVESQVYGRSDGLLSSECNGGSEPAGWRDRDGRMWFPTIRGVVSLDPDNLQVNPVMPPVIIEEVLVDGRSLDVDRDVVLAPGTQHYDFRYTALTFLGTDKVRFRYKLEGLDSDWIEAGTRRTAYYNTLPPGEYVFQVVACNSDGIWNVNGASYRLIQKPHFHETKTFYAFCVFVLVFLVAGLFMVRIRQMRKREEELVRAVGERTRELRQLARELKELTLIDPLTGLRNRRFLFETITPVMEELSRQRAQAEKASGDRRSGPGGDGMGALIIDIDHFKSINDTWGHDAGDVVLKEFARLLLDCVRAQDVSVRWGGEEFLVVLPQTRRDSLFQFAERIRTRVEDHLFQIPGETVHITCSIGLAVYPFFGSSDVDLSLNQLITVADMGLYTAKHEGRNRSIHVTPGERTPADTEEVRRALADLEWAEEAGLMRVERSGDGYE